MRSAGAPRRVPIHTQHPYSLETTPSSFAHITVRRTDTVSCSLHQRPLLVHQLATLLIQVACLARQERVLLGLGRHLLVLHLIISLLLGLELPTGATLHLGRLPS